jgi:sugar fermentation stimulation protein A
VVVRLPDPLLEAVLIKRYKRFLADVRLPNGQVVTAHTPNTGSMKGCSEPGSKVWLSDSGKAHRKYPWTWELVETQAGALVGINTGLTNQLVREGIASRVISELAGYHRVRTEVRCGAGNSRVDLLLEAESEAHCYVEVKNVTLAQQEIALFPDAVSVRAGKHLRTLAEVAQAGYRAVIFFCVQREDVNEVRPADGVDPEYGRTLREVLAQGVEALAYRAEISTQEIKLYHRLPVICP